MNDERDQLYRDAIDAGCPDIALGHFVLSNWQKLAQSGIPHIDIVGAIVMGLLATGYMHPEWLQAIVLKSNMLENPLAQSGADDIIRAFNVSQETQD